LATTNILRELFIDRVLNDWEHVARFKGVGQNHRKSFMGYPGSHIDPLRWAIPRAAQLLTIPWINLLHSNDASYGDRINGIDLPQSRVSQSMTIKVSASW
jgi:hypothetical protein